jgi:hypothetical protein
MELESLLHKKARRCAGNLAGNRSKERSSCHAHEQWIDEGFFPAITTDPIYIWIWNEFIFPL